MVVGRELVTGPGTQVAQKLLTLTPLSSHFMIIRILSLKSTNLFNNIKFSN